MPKSCPVGTISLPTITFVTSWYFYAYTHIYKYIYISNLFVYLYHVFFPNAKQRVPVYNLGVWGLDPCSPPVGMNICCEHEFTNEHVVHVFFNELGKSIDILNWRK